LIKSGYEITIVTCNTHNVATFETMRNQNIIRFPCWNILNQTYPIPKPTLTSIKIIIFLLKTDFQISVTHTRFYPLCFLGFLISKIKKIPSIHTEHGSRHTVSTNTIVSLVSRLYDHSFGFLIIRFSNQNICISQKTKDFIQHLGGKKSIVIYNGIDMSEYAFIAKKNKGFHEDFITIAYLGRLIYSKGVQDIISIVPKIHKNIKVLIIGGGPYRTELEKLSQISEKNKILF
jgi:glycosyltransferase involved in cell wall biosynthesis